MRTPGDGQLQDLLLTTQLGFLAPPQEVPGAWEEIGGQGTPEA